MPFFSTSPASRRTASALRAAPARRTVLGAAGAAAAGLALSACGGPGSSSAGAGASDGGSASGSLSFYHWRSEDRTVLEDLAATFAEQHDGLAVEQVIDPSDQYQSTAAQKAKDGDVGDALTAFRGTQLEQFAELGIFTDLTDAALVGGYEPNLISPGIHDGAQLGVPYQLVFNMPLLNTDLAEQAGISEVPGDWDAYVDALDRLKGIGVDPIAWPGGDAANAFQIINSLAMNNGPTDDMFARIESGEYAATDDWWLRSLEQFATIAQYFQANFEGTTTDGAVALFGQGQAAILPTGSFHIGVARAAGAEFGIDLSPVMTNDAGTDPAYEGIFNSTFILGVNTQATNPDGALAWIEFLSDPENAALYADGTAQHVTVQGVEYTNPDLQALSPWQSRAPCSRPASSSSTWTSAPRWRTPCSRSRPGAPQSRPPRRRRR
ncbi:ABC transporter substrate-binding protein [Brachybacterium sp. DNPG3]